MSPPRPPSPQKGPHLAIRASRLQETMPFPPFPARNFTFTASMNILTYFKNLVIIEKLSFVSTIFTKLFNQRPHVFHEFCIWSAHSCHTIQIHEALDNRIHTPFKCISSMDCHLYRCHHLLSERKLSQCFTWETFIQFAKISLILWEIVFILFRIFSHKNQGWCRFLYSIMGKIIKKTCEAMT